MNTELTVFLVLVCVVLLGNAALLMFLWLVFRQPVRVFEHQDRHIQSIRALGTALGQMEVASAQLVKWSEKANAGVRQFGSECERAENWLQYGLAKLDFNVDKASARLEAGSRQVSEAVGEPLYRSATILQGVKALLELLSLGLPREDAGPRSAA